VDNKVFNKLVNELSAKLNNGCQSGVDVLKNNTPVDTQRLYESTRASNVELENDVLKCKIIAGGLSLYGVRRETERVRDVNYAIFLELKYHYIRNCLLPIINQILSSLKR
jgi:hypothetical protein